MRSADGLVSTKGSLGGGGGLGFTMTSPTDPNLRVTGGSLSNVTVPREGPPSGARAVSGKTRDESSGCARISGSGGSSLERRAFSSRALGTCRRAVIGASSSSPAVGGAEGTRTVSGGSSGPNSDAN
jgi:hypothetical protein